MLGFFSKVSENTAYYNLSLRKGDACSIPTESLVLNPTRHLNLYEGSKDAMGSSELHTLLANSVSFVYASSVVVAYFDNVSVYSAHKIRFHPVSHLIVVGDFLSGERLDGDEVLFSIYSVDGDSDGPKLTLA